MSNFSTSITFDIVLNLVSAFADIIALLICIIFLCVIIYRLIQIKYNRDHGTINIPLILSINILCTITIKSTLQITHVTIPTIMKDFQIITEFNETSFHRIRAYMLWSSIGILYWSYVLLAFFRFIRIIYPTYLWIERSFLYIYIIIPIQFISICLIMSPLILIFDILHQIPNEVYCSILLKPFYPFIYTNIIIFFAPYIILCIFYVCITRKLRKLSIIRQTHERNRRDFIIIRRMLLNMIILCIVAIPSAGLYLNGTIRNNFHSVVYRVQWLSSSFASCIFSTMLPLVTTKLRDFLRLNRLIPANNQNVT